jgi:hypothetical protein
MDLFDYDRKQAEKQDRDKRRGDDLVEAIRSVHDRYDGNWVPADTLREMMRIADVRKLREIAAGSHGRVISRTHGGGGYKLTCRATHDEAKRAADNYKARAEKLLKRHTETLNQWHNKPRD